MPEDDLIERLGEEEGNRLHNELEAQIGAQTVRAYDTLCFGL